MPRHDRNPGIDFNEAPMTREQRNEFANLLRKEEANTQGAKEDQARWDKFGDDLVTMGHKFKNRFNNVERR